MNNKRFFNSLKFKVFIYCAGFSIILLVMLWGFQTVFLNDFYKYVKTEQVQGITEKIGEEIVKEDIDSVKFISYIDNILDDTDYCVNIHDTNGRIIYQNTANRSVCGMIMDTPLEVNRLYRDARRNKNGVSVIRDTENKRETNSEIKSMSYGKIFKNKNGNDYFVLVNAKVSVVSEIASTLSQQLLIITVLMLMIAVAISYIAYVRIAKPLAETTKKAKKFAKGQLDVNFDIKGYQEITELNDTLNYASDELRKIENLRNELIANVSHDFRTPLTMIAGYSEMIRDIPEENTPENIQVILDECNRLTQLVNDLLDLSKLKSSNEKLNLSIISITDLCEGICNRFNIMLKKDNYTIKFEGDCDIFVEADEIKLNQVLYNIIGNAVHYTGEDNLVVVKQIITDDNYVRIEIIDSGKGIKEEEIPYVWERYYKSNKVTKRQQIGTGIGLSIVKGILELHNARYGVYRNIDKKGTTFYFEIPIKENI